MNKKQSEMPLIITANECNNCPAFEQGQKVTLMGRCILRSGTTANCALLMKHISPLVIALESNINPIQFGIDIKRGVFRCRDSGCHASFRMRQMKMSEINEIYNQQSKNVLSFDKEKKWLWNLENIPFIKKLDIEFSTKIIRNATTIKYCAGSIILKKGLRYKSLYIINKGSARVLINKSFKKGDTSVAATLGIGEIFGEFSLAFNRTSPYSVIANSDISLWEIPLAHLEKCLSANGDNRRQFSEVLLDRLTRENFNLPTILKSGARASFNFFSIIDIIQKFKLAKIDGCIIININNIQQGFVNFEHGDCVHAEYNKKIGLEAIVKIVNIKEGYFYYDKQIKNSSRTLDNDIIPLLQTLAMDNDDENIEDTG